LVALSRTARTRSILIAFDLRVNAQDGVNRFVFGYLKFIDADDDGIVGLDRFFDNRMRLPERLISRCG